ncbi:hypothetical protein BDK51DRAFT_47229 [Blyttiomyces helicus]|uniref:Uncharacterized protein n=1 Tax=Blyttiomyces helicus TaxID=388810 RepID=A0A4V1IQD0_9FUNG|nr:hypothetical protein BDK51DRAFT_47229 [Blyttiomyces helicus]|eukprot:RKO86127.1 hypothetical protein BDK51DRAFT_47229 [Blyttiomyces helicus]
MPGASRSTSPERVMLAARTREPSDGGRSGPLVAAGVAAGEVDSSADKDEGRDDNTEECGIAIADADEVAAVDIEVFRAAEGPNETEGVVVVEALGDLTVAGSGRRERQSSALTDGADKSSHAAAATRAVEELMSNGRMGQGTIVAPVPPCRTALSQLSENDFAEAMPGTNSGAPLPRIPTTSSDSDPPPVTASPGGSATCG